MTIQGDDFNYLFAQCIYYINTNGEWTKPRGLDCKEIICPTLVLKDASKALCTIKERKLNYAYLIIEKMTYLSGVSKPDVLFEYNGKMRDFFNKEINDFDGAYGPRLKGQMEWCYDELKKDKDSRRAVMTIHNASDNHETKDSACTLNLHFIIRDNKLILITNMRSNDVKWGLCLDVPAFVFLQEVMACWLNLEMGVYIHQPHSLHYYKEFESELLDYQYMVEEPYTPEIMWKGTNNNKTIPKWDVSRNLTYIALNDFWTEEENIRRTLSFNPTKYHVINEYLAELLKYWDGKKKYDKKTSDI